MVGFEWAGDYALELSNQGIISGTQQNQLEPGRILKREEFVKMLVLAAGIKNTIDTPVSFRDVSEDAWYYTYIKDAVNMGIVNGISENEFGIGERIKRQDLVTMVYRTLNICNAVIPITKEMNNFNDSEQISNYAKPAVESMYMADVIGGYEDGTFKPNESADRAASFKIIYKLLKLIDGGVTTVE